MKQSKHTPTPWKAKFHTAIVNEEGLTIADCHIGQKSNSTVEANRAFIVKACNNYDALVRVLELIDNHNISAMRSWLIENGEKRIDNDKPLIYYTYTFLCELIAEQALSQAKE